MKKKIGIVTFHRADNYGAVLQCMALGKYVAACDPDANVATLDYRCEYLEKPYHQPIYNCNTKNPIKYAKRIVRKLRYYKDSQQRKEAFEKFRSCNLQMTQSYTKEELLRACPRFDLLITGSDQVWNGRIVGDWDDRIYTLDFPTGGQRVSYAASAGSSTMIGNGTLQRIEKLDKISVREEEVALFLESKMDKEIVRCVDPVFLLTCEQWNDVLPKGRIMDEPFIFAYCISGDRKKEVAQIAMRLAAENHCKVVFIDPEENYGAYGECCCAAGPLDFVRYIRDAQVVVASSFHAAAFSAIFGKKCIALPGAGSGVRITEVLNALGGASCIVQSVDEFASQYTDLVSWPEVDAADKLENYRASSQNYIQTLLAMEDRGEF